MQFELAYAAHTDVYTTLNDSALDFATNLRRMPVSFRGVVKEPVVMRQLMVAMHEVIIGDFRENFRGWVLDPVITVHPDELFFEAFSTDQSAYVRLSAATDAFEVEGESVYGTTNIDFTFALRAALNQLRSSRRTQFGVGAGGFAVQTTGKSIKGVEQTHFEQKVDLPDTWVKGFLQVQSALAMKPYTFDVRPVDLMSAIRYFVDNRPPKPPHGLRYEFVPGEAIRIVLEPWEKTFFLTDTGYDGYPRSIRTWGRRRLELLLAVLPYADRVTVGVLGRGLPHFYICHCGDYKFTLVLSGWVRNDWSSTSALDLLAPQTEVDGEQIASVYNALVQHLKLKRSEVEAYTLLDSAQTEAALFRLCREGRAMVDPTTRRYRSRELFADGLDIQRILAPDPRIEQGKALAASGVVTLHSVAPSDVRHNEIKILGTVQIDGKSYETLVAVDQELRLRFAQCDCDFFREHIMSRGPCEHILATRFAADEALAKVETQAVES
jgi:predicted nucleic acid-binding Zn finger protein